MIYLDLTHHNNIAKDSSCFLCVNKPKGISSAKCVSLVKKILCCKKVGHTGTLDPIATGMLIMCVNDATKIASNFSRQYKHYIATLQIGIKTASADITGNIHSACHTRVERNKFTHALKNFRGEIPQIPNIFSAIKIKGVPAYKMARQGIKDIAMPLRIVTIHSICCLDYNYQYQTAVISTVCSSGTYIRTLIDDLGMHLGTGATMLSLHRVAVGKWHNMINIDDLMSPRVHE